MLLAAKIFANGLIRLQEGASLVRSYDGARETYSITGGADFAASTLVIVGDHDMIRAAHSRRIAGSIPNCKLVTVSGDHFIAAKVIDLISVSARKISIYSLKKLLKVQKDKSINLRSYEMGIHKLLANCLNFILFAVIAALICFPINRYKSKSNMAIKVIIAIISMRFINGILETFAHNGVINVWQANWGVVSVLLCLSVAVLIWKEV